MFQQVSPPATEEQKSTSSHSVRHVFEQAGPEDLVIEHGPVMDEHNAAIEAGCTEELSIQHSLHMKHLEDEHNAAIEAGCTEELSIQYNPHMKYLEDEHIAAKELCYAEELNKHHSIDVKDLQDDVNATLTKSVQDDLDALLFGLSTPSNTNKFNVVTLNIVTESQWSLSDSQFPHDFSNAQVRELEAAKTHEVKQKSPVKRDRKKSKIFRSPYITKFRSSSKDEDSSDNEEKQRYAFDGCTTYEDLPNKLISDYSQWLEIGDYGVFVAAYAEILSEGQQVHSCEFEAASQRARYALLLWHYGVTKAKKDYMSDNDDPPRSKNTFLQSPDESAIVTLE
ncbi:putative protein EIN4-like [Capsicum annuum]|nr:putative protein EIN4-like [Capsicum annuum]